MRKLRSERSADDLSPSDRARILDLITDYSKAWDAADADAFAGLFTEDAVCVFYRDGADSPSATLEGAQDLRHAIESRAGRFRDMGLVTDHRMANTQLEVVDATTVRAHSHGTVFWQMPARDPQRRPVQTGTYESVIVRRDEGWRFRKRVIRLSGLFEVEDVYPGLGR